MPRSITVKQASSKLRELGMTIRNTGFGDYRVNFLHGEERTAYYSDDLDDCVGTAFAMYNHRMASIAALVGAESPSKEIH